jgi:hypothetical protein
MSKIQSDSLLLRSPVQVPHFTLWVKTMEFGVLLFADEVIREKMEVFYFALR